MRNAVKVLIFSFLLLSQYAGAQDSRGVSYGLFIDNSGSMRSQVELLKSLAKEIAARVGNDDLVSIYEFTNDESSKVPKVKAQAGLECSKDEKAIVGQVSGIYSVGGQTTIYDAIDFSAKSLVRNLGEKCSAAKEVILIVIGDGEDRASQLKFKDLLAELKGSTIRIFAIGLIEELDSNKAFLRSSDKSRSKRILEDLTKATNGKVIFPNKKQEIKEIVDELFKAIEN